MQIATPTEREKRHEIRKQIGKGPLDQGNPTTIRQEHHFPTSHPKLSLLDNIIPNRLGLIKGSQLKTKILQKQGRNPACQNTNQTIHIIDITHRNHFDLARLIFKPKTDSKHKNNK
jgi:hypothetical protein